VDDQLIEAINPGPTKHTWPGGHSDVQSRGEQENLGCDGQIARVAAWLIASWSVINVILKRCLPMASTGDVRPSFGSRIGLPRLMMW
jgi:hypothetical protein